jgi:hypothetical protein
MAQVHLAAANVSMLRRVISEGVMRKARRWPLMLSAFAQHRA